MSKTIDRLRTDHARLRAVLDTISEFRNESQSESMESQSDHLFCLIDYLLGYPDEVHHPTEDLVFDKMLTLDLAQEELEKVEKNRMQHETLKAATLELMDLVQSPGFESNMAQLLDKLDEFVGLQSKHMQFEEQEIFPLAEQYIPDAAWQELDEHFGEAKDPLFDEADHRFAALFRLLVPSDEANARRAAPLLQYLSATRLNVK